MAELEKSLLDPDAEVLPANRSFRAITHDGKAVAGTLLNHDSFSVQILNADNRLVTLPKALLRERGYLTKSPLPSYRDTLTSQEVADLVRYLASVKG
jgi:hypothetical protein